MFRNEDGSIIALSVITMTAILFGSCLVFGVVSNSVIAKTKAQIGADAAALAGARGGEAIARVAAEQNNGKIEEYRNFGDDVEIRVRHKSAIARSRARRESPRP